MDAWWIYEVPNAQAAFDAVIAIERAYTPDGLSEVRHQRFMGFPPLVERELPVISVEMVE